MNIWVDLISISCYRPSSDFTLLVIVKNVKLGNKCSLVNETRMNHPTAAYNLLTGMVLSG